MARKSKSPQWRRIAELVMIGSLTKGANYGSAYCCIQPRHWLGDWRFVRANTNSYHTTNKKPRTLQARAKGRLAYVLQSLLKAQPQEIRERHYASKAYFDCIYPVFAWFILNLYGLCYGRKQAAISPTTFQRIETNKRARRNYPISRGSAKRIKRIPRSATLRLTQCPLILRGLYG